MRERHPFVAFVPKNAKYLLLGSFPGKLVDGNDWFYGTKRGQFWPILSEIYKKELKSIEQKQKLFEELNLAVTDVILEADRAKNSNLDSNLKNLIFNTAIVSKILTENKIEIIYFSSRFVQKTFRSKFKDLIQKYAHIELITLPSSSPRFVGMKKEEKVLKYKDLLPQLK